MSGTAAFKYCMRFFLFSIFTSIVFLYPHASAGDRDQLLDRLTAPRALGSVTVSTKGTFIAGLVHYQGQRHLAVWYRTTGYEGTFSHTGLVLKDIQWIKWATDMHLIVGLRDTRILNIRPGDTESVTLLGGEGGDISSSSIVSILPQDPDHILLQWAEHDEEQGRLLGYPSVFRVNIHDGTFTRVQKARAPISLWWADAHGNLRVGTGYRERKQQVFIAGGLDEDGVQQWQHLRSGDVFTDPVFDIQAIEDSGDTLAVITSHNSDQRELWRYDTKDERFTERIGFNSTHDMDGALVDPATGQVVGAHYVAEGPQQLYHDRTWQAMHTLAVQKTGFTSIRFLGGSAGGAILIIRALPENEPPRYYTMERDTGQVMPLWPYGKPDESLRIDKTAVWIARTKTATGKRMKRGDLPNRKMQAILSTPTAGPTGKAVVLVHGGPVRRVNMQYSALVSWLVLNGYTVLQPNFIGSSGYGESWRRAGYGQWGRRMQKDIAIAGRWLLDNGFAGTGDLCVMGGSYGGYTALLEAQDKNTPFRCAISLNGVTSVPHLVEYLSGFRYSALTVPRIRMSLTLQAMQKVSPVNRARRTRLPVLLLHATEDRNVPFIQGRDMAAVLQEREKAVEFITLEGAEHVLRRQQDRKTYYQAALEFLNKHTGQQAQGT